MGILKKMPLSYLESLQVSTVVLPNNQLLSAKAQISGLDTLSGWSGAQGLYCLQGPTAWLTLPLRPTWRSRLRTVGGRVLGAGRSWGQLTPQNENKHRWGRSQETLRAVIPNPISALIGQGQKRHYYQKFSLCPTAHMLKGQDLCNTP